ncbi:hypothetical protein GCM10022236_36980 [Microlunatus ginsengisoli]|uniref:Uncharacterized protein n=1 Tax=Microlunatus ginsengisoli TaxID=363863 RepID=A0ABP7AFD7_9ACTN
MEAAVVIDQGRRFDHVPHPTDVYLSGCMRDNLAGPRPCSTDRSHDLNGGADDRDQLKIYRDPAVTYDETISRGVDTAAGHAGALMQHSGTALPHRPKLLTDGTNLDLCGTQGHRRPPNPDIPPTLPERGSAHHRRGRRRDPHGGWTTRAVTSISQVVHEISVG